MRTAVQLGLGVALGMPLAGRLYYLIQEDPAVTGAALVAAVVPGIGVMLLLGLLACTGPLVRALRAYRPQRRGETDERALHPAGQTTFHATCEGAGIGSTELLSTLETWSPLPS